MLIFALDREPSAEAGNCSPSSRDRAGRKVTKPRRARAVASWLWPMAMMLMMGRRTRRLPPYIPVLWVSDEANAARGIGGGDGDDWLDLA